MQSLKRAYSRAEAGGLAGGEAGPRRRSASGSAAARPATPRQAARTRGAIDGLLEAAAFAALGDRTRVALLACAAKCGRACSVSELAGCCSVDLSVVSRQLRTLERAGLMTSQRRGREVRYSVRYADISGMLRRLADELDACGAACGDGCRGAGCCGASGKECACG